MDSTRVLIISIPEELKRSTIHCFLVSNGNGKHTVIVSHNQQLIIGLRTSSTLIVTLFICMLYSFLRPFPLLNMAQ